MLRFMLVIVRVIDLLLEILFCAEVEVCIIGQEVQSLYRCHSACVQLAAVQKLVDPVNQLLVCILLLKVALFCQIS